MPVRWYALGLITPLAASILALIVFVAVGGAATSPTASVPILRIMSRRRVASS